MANGLLTPEDLVAYLDDPTDPANLRIIAATDDWWASVCTYLKFDPSTLAEGFWKRECQLVAKRAAARFFDNPLDAQAVQVQSGSGSWTGPGTPRLLTADERLQLRPMRRNHSGMT